MISGKEIEAQVKAERIKIDPFDPANCRPNSYDVTLGGELREVFCNVYNIQEDAKYIDLRAPGVTVDVDRMADGSGWLLHPGTVYLGHTVETIGSIHYAPMIEGRSSVARHGLAVHITAGFGDVGWFGQFVLELVNLSQYPIILRPGDKIAQISFEPVDGTWIHMYDGVYQGQTGVRPSKGI